MRHSKGRAKGNAARFVFAAILSTILVVVSAAPAFAYHYSDVVLADLPLSYLRADAGSGSSVVDAAGGSSASCTSSGLWESTGTGPVTGATSWLKGDDSNYCWKGSIGGAGLSSWSVEAWIRVTSGGSHGEWALGFDGTDTSSNTQGVSLGGDSSGFSAFDFWQGTGPSCSFSSLSYTVNSSAPWAHIAYVHTISTDKLYYNGTQCASQSASGHTLNGSGICAVGIAGGVGGCSGNGFDHLESGWRVAQGAIYGFALSAGQVATHYAAQSALPAATLTVSPANAQVRAGHAIEFVYTSTDSSGAVTDGSPYTLLSSTPSGVCTTLTPVGAGNGQLCTATSTTGVYTLHWGDSIGNHATTFLNVVGLAASFAVLPKSCTTTIGGACNFQGFASDASGNDITNTDAWGVSGSLPAHVTCTATRAPGTDTAIENCWADTTGTYTLTFSDDQGIPASVTLIVGAASNQQSCGATDVGCWISNLVGAVTSLPGDIVTALFNLFFTSQGGPSYLDFTPLTNEIIPTTSCRSGQSPTAPDGVNCIAFPFSIPTDIGAIFDIFNATPSAPTLTLAWDFPLWTGTTLHETGTIDPTVVLTNTTMGYVRDAELVLFIIGTALGTWRLLQLVGVD